MLTSVAVETACTLSVCESSCVCDLMSACELDCSSYWVPQIWNKTKIKNTKIQIVHLRHGSLGHFIILLSTVLGDSDFLSRALLCASVVTWSNYFTSINIACSFKCIYLISSRDISRITENTPIMIFKITSVFSDSKVLWGRAGSYLSFSMVFLLLLKNKLSRVFLFIHAIIPTHNRHRNATRIPTVTLLPSANRNTHPEKLIKTQILLILDIITHPWHNDSKHTKNKSKGPPTHLSINFNATLD